MTVLSMQFPNVLAAPTKPRFGGKKRTKGIRKLSQACPALPFVGIRFQLEGSHWHLGRGWEQAAECDDSRPPDRALASAAIWASQKIIWLAGRKPLHPTAVCCSFTLAVPFQINERVKASVVVREKKEKSFL